MLIDRVIWPVYGLGPGSRVAIWTVGCSKRCPKCANKELWAADGTKDISVELLCRMVIESVRGKSADGITVTGGEPLNQIEELLFFLEKIKPQINDILVYTGKTWAEVEKSLTYENIRRLQCSASVLVDGPYIDELNDNMSVLRGSANQTIRYFDDGVTPNDEEYLRGTRIVQNFVTNTGMISVGIHNREGK